MISFLQSIFDPYLLLCMDILKDYYRTADLAKAAGVSVQNFQRYVKLGAFPKPDYDEKGGRGHFWHKERLDLLVALREHLQAGGTLKTFRHAEQGEKEPASAGL